MEELEHAVDHAGRVDALRLELLHDVEELRARGGQLTRRAQILVVVRARARARGRGRAYGGGWISAGQRGAERLGARCQGGWIRAGPRAGRAGDRQAHLVVNVRLLLKLHLDLVEVREGVLDLELPVGHAAATAARGRASHARQLRHASLLRHRDAGICCRHPVHHRGLVGRRHARLLRGRCRLLGRGCRPCTRNRVLWR